MKKFFALFVFCFGWLCMLNATTLHVEQLQGSDFAMAVKQIGKLIINGSKLEFYDRQGEKIYTSDIQKVSVMTFDPVAETSDPNAITPSDPGDPNDPNKPGGNEDDNANQALENVFAGEAQPFMVYPNPANSILIVNGADEQAILRLYSLDGRLIKKAVGATMNVEEVPNGDYLLQCENQIFKIIKQ